MKKKLPFDPPQAESMPYGPTALNKALRKECGKPLTVTKGRHTTGTKGT